MSAVLERPSANAEKGSARTLGILGGMGPAATADFIAKLIQHTAATRDEEHVPFVVINDPRIPDRTEAYMSGRETEVLDALTLRLRRLEDAGVDGVAMPCNSAHHWADELQRRTHLPLLHIADAALDAVALQAPAARRVAVMGTVLTQHSGFYQARMAQRALVFHPIETALTANTIMPGINCMKAGDAQTAAALLNAAVDQVFADGAEAILLACTEIPVALRERTTPGLIDANAALARACVAWARG